MSQYKTFFKTLYDGVTPADYIGKSTHYTFLRCVIWHDHMLAPLKKGKYLDFAIIWNDNHNDLLISFIEDLYINGLLSPSIFVGERNGIFTLITQENSIFTTHNGDITEYEFAIQNISERLHAPWSTKIFPYLSRELDIICDSYDCASFLEELKHQWQLGIKDVTNDNLLIYPIVDYGIDELPNMQSETSVIQNLFENLYNAIDAETTDINTNNILNGTRIQALYNFKKAGYTSVQDGRSKFSRPKSGEVPYDVATSFFNARFLKMTKTRYLIAEEVAKLKGQSFTENRQLQPNEAQRADNLKQQLFCLNHFLKTGEYSTNVSRSKKKGYILNSEVSHPDFFQSKK